MALVGIYATYQSHNDDIKRQAFEEAEKQRRQAIEDAKKNKDAARLLSDELSRQVSALSDRAEIVSNQLRRANISASDVRKQSLILWDSFDTEINKFSLYTETIWTKIHATVSNEAEYNRIHANFIDGTTKTFQAIHKCQFSVFLPSAGEVYAPSPAAANDCHLDFQIDQVRLCRDVLVDVQSAFFDSQSAVTQSNCKAPYSYKDSAKSASAS